MKNKISQAKFIERCYIEGKEKVFEEFGFVPYYDGWIKQEWIEQNKPYEKMVLPEIEAIKHIVIF